MASLQSVTNKLEAERAELDAVLASGILGKTNNQVRLLTYVCEKYFEGETDEIKEYSIAVYALGRPQNFDPQVDTIVRVTAHTLRKRLEEYYRTEGAEHALHICLPTGRYVPNFVRKGESIHGENGHGVSTAASPANGTSVSHEATTLVTHTREAASPGSEVKLPPKRYGRLLLVGGLILIFVAGVTWYSKVHKTEQKSSAQTLLPTIINSGNTIRALIGEGRAPYSDEVGSVWESDRFCSGGESFTVSKAAIQATDDTQLFLGGRRGTIHCKFPVPSGTYEVHLLFAETGGLVENARNVGFTLNDGPAHFVDVVDDAGAGDTATTKVFTDVQPQADGSIHLDFLSVDSFVNAVEITPVTPHSTLPIRIVAGRRTSYHDVSGNIWLPDRYYFGGRASSIGNDVSKLPDGGLYQGQRIGHFHYAIPVAPGKEYTLKLYFLERWFGIQNQNIGGVGSRIFDVWCNGNVLLNNFDIMAEGGSKTLVKTFPHIKPTAQGKIEIYFKPAVNYPAVSGIEVLPEQ
jgi:hypothetical protein